VIYYFTKSDLFGSKLIRWAFDDRASHMALAFEFEGKETILESRIETGFSTTTKKEFFYRNTLVNKVELTLPLDDEILIYDRTIRKLKDTRYDYNGILFWGAIALAYKMDFIAEDKADSMRNRWADKDSAYCVELLRCQMGLLESIGFDVSYLKRQMLRPDKALELLINCKGTKVLV
jgi:hypothetical protein